MQFGEARVPAERFCDSQRTMGLRQRLLAGTARQLGHPSGLRGRIVGRALNRENRDFVVGAVRACEVRAGEEAADIGFGGGVGLGLLLDAVGSSGRVHGVDLSTTMVDRARHGFAAECAAGRLTVAVGSMLDLPLEVDSVDAAITVNTMYFVDDIGTAFGEFARVLRPGGRVVVGIGDPVSMARMQVTAHGFRLRPPEEILGAMTAAGLVEIRDEPFSQGERKGHFLIGTRSG